MCLGKVVRGCVEVFCDKFSFKESWNIDDTAEENDTENIFENSVVGILRPGTFSVGKWITNS